MRAPAREKVFVPAMLNNVFLYQIKLNVEKGSKVTNFFINFARQEKRGGNQD